MGFAFTLIYLATSYLRPQDYFPELAPYRVMLWLATLCALPIAFELARGLHLWSKLPQVYLMLALMFWVGLSVAFNGWIGGALQAWVSFGTAALPFFFVVATVTTVRRLKLLCAVIALCTVILAIQGTLAYHFGINEEMLVLHQSASDLSDGAVSPAPDEEAPTLRRIRSVGFMNDPNDLAQTFVLSLPLLIALGHGGRLMRVTSILGGSLLLYGLVLTWSRGAGIALVVLSFLLAKPRLGVKAAGLTAAIALSGAMLLSLSQGRAMSASEESAAGRLDAWSVGITLLREHPFVGVGFDRFLEYNRLTAHNSFVLCFSELGLGGYFIWLGLLGVSAFQMNKTIRLARLAGDYVFLNWCIALQTSLYVYLAAAFFLSRTYNQTLYVLLGIIAAVVLMYQGRLPAGSKVSTVPWVKTVIGFEAASLVVIYLLVVGSHVWSGS